LEGESNALTDKTSPQLWDWSLILQHWQEHWAPESPLTESYLWEGLGAPPLDLQGPLILGIQAGDQPNVMFVLKRTAESQFVQKLLTRLRQSSGIDWIVFPGTKPEESPRDLWGWFAHGGDWWITEAHPELEAFWILSKPHFIQARQLRSSPPVSRSIQHFSRPFLWAPLAKGFPQTLGRSKVRWVPRGWQNLTASGQQSGIKFRWEDQIFYTSRNWDPFLRSLKLEPIVSRDEAEGLAWTCEVGGGQLPLIRKLERSKGSLLGSFWNKNLSTLRSETFRKGGQSLLSGSPYLSTLFYYLGDADVLTILGNFLLGHREFRRGGISRLFYYKGKAKEGERFFSSPFYNKERLEDLLPPGHSLQPDRFALDFQEWGTLNTRLLKELQGFPEAKLPLTPLGRNLLIGLQKKIQEDLQEAIQSKRQDGFPDQFFRKIEPSNKQWGMHYLSDRTIALALFAAEEDIWRDLRYHVSPRRMERLLDEKAVIRGQLGRGKNLLDEMWLAFEEFQFRLENPFLTFIPL
jgi:hypothetical protein